MSVIGEQIKKYRIEKGITQEQLGQMIGVTTQGVSRWERGGTPDAEILPRLSEILGVSIDTLFGREEQSLAMSLARRLSQMEEEEAYHYAFNICWAIELGLMGNNSVFEDFVNKFLDPTVLNEDKKLDYFAKNIHENGMANLRMSPDLNHFFLLLQPKGNLKDQLCDRESLRKVFAAFADDKLTSCASKKYQSKNKMFDTSQRLQRIKQFVDKQRKIISQHFVDQSGTKSTKSFGENSFGLKLL